MCGVEDYNVLTYMQVCGVEVYNVRTSMQVCGVEKELQCTYIHAGVWCRELQCTYIHAGVCWLLACAVEGGYIVHQTYRVSPSQPAQLESTGYGRDRSL